MYVCGYCLCVREVLRGLVTGSLINELADTPPMPFLSSLRTASRCSWRDNTPLHHRVIPGTEYRVPDIWSHAKLLPSENVGSTAAVYCCTRTAVYCLRGIRYLVWQQRSTIALTIISSSSDIASPSHSYTHHTHDARLPRAPFNRGMSPATSSITWLLWRAFYMPMSPSCPVSTHPVPAPSFATEASLFSSRLPRSCTDIFTKYLQPVSMPPRSRVAFSCRCCASSAGPVDQVYRPHRKGLFIMELLYYGDHSRRRWGGICTT